MALPLSKLDKKLLPTGLNDLERIIRIANKRKDPASVIILSIAVARSRDYFTNDPIGPCGLKGWISWTMRICKCDQETCFHHRSLGESILAKAAQEQFPMFN